MSPSTDMDATLSPSRQLARANSISDLASKYSYQTRPAGALQHHGSSSSFSSSVGREGGGGSAPPAQSRDATARSRFFSSNPTSENGTVLVPNSSPLTQRHSTEYAPYQSSFNNASIPGFGHPHSGYNPSLNPSHSLGWAHHGGFNISDPLSRPSGFITSSSSTSSVSSAAHAQYTHSRPAPPLGRSSVRRIIDDDDDSGSERPRKRLSRRQTPEREVVLVGDSSPARGAEVEAASPEVMRFGQKRKPGVGRRVDSPTSSDESFPADGAALLAGPSRPRIIKQSSLMQSQSPAPFPQASSLPQTPTDYTEMTKKFVMVNPTYPPALVGAIYKENRFDARKATMLLTDGDYMAQRMNTYNAAMASPSAAPAVVGRVTEIDEEREKARAAEREKAAKSAIYRRRAEMENFPKLSTPPASSPVMSMPDTPDSPILMRRARPKANRVVDSGSEDSDDDVKMISTRVKPKGVLSFRERALQSFNDFAKDALRELTGCTPEHADAIVKLRPFSSVEDLEQKLGLKKKKTGPAGLSPRIFEDCVEVYKGYGTVDAILENCERVGQQLSEEIAAWTGESKLKDKEKGKGKATSLDPDVAEDGALTLHELHISNSSKSGSKGLLTKPPALLASGVQLKDYQLLGVSWLNLLKRKGLSCILADEMGLGKTVQVISLIAYLKANGNRGPHLIVVPSSTLENWCREFERFAPSIAIQTYYADKDERPQLRQTLRESMASKRKLGTNSWEVLITTYNLAVGDGHDKKFFQNIPWDMCVFDEGHVLKNFQSQRYSALVKIQANWKLLLTGTPLQNNLQELVSIMFFILPEYFSSGMEELRTIFKVRSGESKIQQLLAEERVSRAKKMMTPFVLRRRKDQVLKDLPKKTERIEWCEMTTLQRRIYRDAMKRSRKTILELAESIPDKDVGSSKPGPKTRPPVKGKENKGYVENSANVLMELRKAALHPMLFRTRFDDKTLSEMTKLLLKEPDFRKRGAIFQYVKEDMEVMTDAELQVFCKTYKSTKRFQLDEDCYVDAGKVKMLLKLLERYQGEGRKCLIFSQFTQVLDILQVILKQRSIKYLLLTGSTPVDVRQGLVDEFTEDAEIPVFLLSTKAGGMGINLTAASVVIMFDQDFNPHNDKQAADRAYRIGQKRTVEVVKLVMKGTIEEDMLRLGQTKLALDEAVAGEAAAAASTDGEVSSKGGKENAPEKIMRESLMETLRKQFEEDDKRGGGVEEDDEEAKGNEDVQMAETDSRKGKVKKVDGRKNVKKGQPKTAKVIEIDSDSELTDID